MCQLRVPFDGHKTSTTTSDNQSFFDEYVARLNDPIEVKAWLLDHAHELDEAVFCDEKNDWSTLSREQLLVLRVYGPFKAFTPVAKAGLLTKVARNPELKAAADAIFTQDDLKFLQSLTRSERLLLHPEMIRAYNLRIRPPDTRVINYSFGR